jgi:hypothetical protein
MKRVMAGMDLHGNNVMIGIVDADGTRLRHRRLACDLEEVIAFLNPYKPFLDRVAVESARGQFLILIHKAAEATLQS